MPVFTSTKGQSDLPRYFPQVFDTISRIKQGRLEFQLPDGRVFQVNGPKPGPSGRIIVKNRDFFTRMIREGEIALSASYLDDWWTSEDLQGVLDVVMGNYEEISQQFPGIQLLRLFERALFWMKSNSKVQARKNISYHYDLGNDFYSKWLDETMTYSSALFETGQEELSTAQTQKYASICNEMRMKEGDNILEIGCGWGGFAEYAAGQRGANITGITISKEQHDFAKKRIFSAGLSEKVDIVMRDYRDERGTYDGVASIEMVEAVGEKYWPVYFDMVRNSLKPGANGTLQVITIPDHLFPGYRKTVDFIQKYIFPGGMLPSPSALEEQILNAGLVSVRSKTFGQSYSQTLLRWHKAFSEQWEDISKLGFDQRFKRMWDFYLTSCASGFKYEVTDVTQVTVARQ